MTVNQSTSETINRVQRDAYDSGLTVGRQQWQAQAIQWHHAQAYEWDGLALKSRTTDAPGDSECRLMAEIHRYMAERIEGKRTAEELYRRVLLFPVKSPQT